MMTDAADIDHKRFVAGLSPETKAELTARSDTPGLRHLALHFGFIVLCGALIASGAPLWPLLIPVQGILLVFLFTLEHEATHKTPFASETLNEWVGQACGLILVLPFTWFRYFHLAHHRFTNIPGKDPELLAGAKPETWSAYVWHVSGLPYWASMLRQVVVNAFGRPEAAYLPERARDRIRTEALWMLAIYALATLSLVATPVLLWVWILPMFIGQPFLRLYLLAEHGRCKPVANMFENTRTTFTNRIVRFLAWNMPYHVEHHAYPAVPFHKLPALHNLTAPHLKVTADGYTEFTRESLGLLGENP